MDILQLVRIIAMCAIISTAIIAVRAAVDFNRAHLRRSRRMATMAKDIDALGQAATSIAAAIEANAAKRARAGNELP